MNDTLKRAASVAVFFAGVAPAFAQGPSDAQRAAIRSACRSDYIAHCSSVPPGGAESLQCLQKNMSSLSASCKAAVNAVQPPAAKTDAPAAAPKADAPAAEPAKPAATAAPAAAPATPAAPTATPAASAAPKAPAAARKTAPGPAATTSAPAATPAAPPAAPAMTLRPLRPREQVLVLRSACGADVRTLCAGVAPGGGRIVQCLAANAAALSPACRDVLSRFSASR